MPEQTPKPSDLPLQALVSEYEQTRVINPDRLNNFIGYLPGGAKRVMQTERARIGVANNLNRTRREVMRIVGNIDPPHSELFLDSTLDDFFASVDAAIKTTGFDIREINELVTELNAIPAMSDETTNKNERRHLERKRQILARLNPMAVVIARTLLERGYMITDLAA